MVLSARVHPGETPSSWIMRGCLHFLTGKETLDTKMTLTDCVKVTLSPPPSVLWRLVNVDIKQVFEKESTGGPHIFWFLVPKSNHEMQDSWIPGIVFSVRPQNGSKTFPKSTFWAFFSRSFFFTIQMAISNILLHVYWISCNRSW